MRTANPTQKSVRRALAAVLLAALAQTGAHAAVMDLAKAPLYNSTTSTVKPNLMFILDNSGSMGDDTLPDDVPNNTRIGYYSSQCNGVAFNPATTYTLPVDSNGDPMSAPSFSSAWSDGFAKSGATNLSGKFYYKYVGTEPAISYTYSTSGVITSTNFYKECNLPVTNFPTATITVSGSSSTSVTSIKVNGTEVLSAATSASSTASTVATRIRDNVSASGYSASVSGTTVTITGPNSAAAITPVITKSGSMSVTTTAFTPFVKVSVSSTSGPSGSDERQNYANWFSYYRTRMLMMKTAVGQAFKTITSNFRVGLTTISYTGASDANAGFLHIDDFVSGSGGQKDTFYSKLYAASGSSYTPLRGALAKAGKIFAGNLGADPMQYSCQQNFALLSTDGYWNTSSETGTYGPFGLDGSPVGQQDGDAPKPMHDGGTSTVTDTTKTVTTTVVTTPKTVVDRSTRTVTTTNTTTRSRADTYTRTTVTWAREDCGNNYRKSTTKVYTGSTTETETSSSSSAQTQEQTTTTVSNVVDTTTSTMTRTVVTSNGTVVSDTTTGPVTNTTSATSVVSGPTNSGWNNVGAPTPGSSGPTSSYSPAIGSINWGSPTSSTMSSTCVHKSTVSNSDNAVLSSSGPWSTPSTSTNTVTSGSSHDGAYPQTTLGTPNTVVTGPTVGPTVTTKVESGGSPNTLADVAMYYYKTDLRCPGSPTSGTTGADLCPKNADGVYSPNVPGNGEDNNPKPHMTTFTLGLGVNGLLKYSPSYATDATGDFADIKAGTKGWTDPDTSSSSPYGNTSNSVIERIDDLWHAAVNGRGTYFSAKDPGALVKSLNAALAGMSARLGYGTSAATSNLAPILGDNALYVASYTSAKWIGNVVAQSIDVDTGAVKPNAAWCVEDVAADVASGIAGCTGKLATQTAAGSDSRKILFNNSGTLTEFKYANLPAGMQEYFDNTKLSQYSSTFDDLDKAAATGPNLVDYLRGQKQYESQADSTRNLYRDRSVTLGDIVDTPPAYVGKPPFVYEDTGYYTWKTAAARQNRAPTVFVGANDGMLHAFDASTGLERWAFIPTPVMPNLYWLADLTYTNNHHNYVDGRLTYFDICISSCSNAASADWRTLLIGGLGSGGRGFYAMDVTDPTTPKLLWEFTAKNDPDLGYSYGNPTAVKKSDGTWVVIVTSGYNNVKLGNGDPYDADGSGQGYLWVLDPMTGVVKDKLGTGEGNKTTPSGLSRMAFWADDADKNPTLVYAYGGDLLGNLWRFDINTTDPSKRVIKLATFTDDASPPNPQPITTKPELANVYGYKVIYVATGKYLEASDLDPTKFKKQTIYAIADTGALVENPRSRLQQQILTDAKPNRTVTKEKVTFDPSPENPKLGWYVDLPDTGERSSVDMMLIQGTLLIPTNVPTNGICEAGGYSWLNYLNYMDGSYVTGASTAGTWTGNDLTTGLNVVWIKGKPVVIRTGSSSPPSLVSGAPFGDKSGQSAIGHRVSWRELTTKD